MRGQECGYKFERLKLKEIMGGKVIGESRKKQNGKLLEVVLQVMCSSSMDH